MTIINVPRYAAAHGGNKMYIIDFNKPVHVHFMGIGGISMSGLAKLLLSRHFTVSGSDPNPSALTDELKSLGADVKIGQCAENITDTIDVVVYTNAISPDNPELLEVQRRNIPLLTRGELMGQVMKLFPHSIGIAGTHGKTTTTSLLSMFFLDAGTDPTISVGGVVPEIGGNFRVGHGEDFIVESCEYKNSFLSFFPTDEIILNIEADHLDFFKDLDDIRCSFRRFAKLVPEGGLVLVNSEIEDLSGLFKGIQGLKTYGVCKNGENADAFDYAAANVTYDDKGCGSFDYCENGKVIGRVSLGLVGSHNVSNAVPAIAMAMRYGIPFSTVQEAAKRFTGTKRRFEYKGTLGGIDIYDDYAHHPTEIKATLTAAKNTGHKRIITVFQPHTYSRTKALLDGFADALSLSDVVVLAKIYAAREKDTGEVSSEDIKNLLAKKGKEAYYFSGFDEIENFLLQFSTQGDMLITMGAGDVVNIGDMLLGH